MTARRGRLGAAALLAAVLSTPLHAQDPLAAADSALAAGDTAAAITRLEQAIRRNHRNAAAHYRLGLIHFRRFEPGTAVSRERRTAEEHFRLAVRFAPDSARYLLALADLLRSETEVTARLQVPDLVNRAVAAARQQGGGAYAEASYRAARIDWERYEHAAHRHRLSGTVEDLDHDAFLNDWNYVEDLIDRRLRPEFAGLPEWRQAEQHLQAAVRADPAHLDAAGLLVVALGERNTWDSAATVAARLRDARPTDGHAWALLGLAHARAGRWPEAEAVFDTALSLLSPAARAPYEHVPLILPPDAPAPDDGAVFWSNADPLWLAAGNEARAEFFARVTYATHRWSDPLRGVRGWETDRGAVYIRYGPPDFEATLGAGGADHDRLVIVPRATRDPGLERLDAAERLDRERNRVLWVYRGPQLRYVFGLTPGFARAVFAGAARHALRRDAARDPVRYDNVPGARVDTVDVLAWRFRRGRDTEVAVFADFVRPLPAGATGGALVRRNGYPVAVDTSALTQGRRTAGPWRVVIPPGTYALRVEAASPDADYRARGSHRLVAEPPGGAPAVSDLVIAGAVTAPAGAGRWSDATIRPLYGPAGPTVAILWETYDLAAAPDGTVRYGVEVRVVAEQLERRGLVARIVGGVADAVGLTAEGDELLTFRYERTGPAGDPAVTLEYLTLDLSGSAAGRYRLEVIVTDRATGSAAQRTGWLDLRGDP